MGDLYLQVYSFYLNLLNRVILWIQTYADQDRYKSRDKSRDEVC